MPDYPNLDLALTALRAVKVSSPIGYKDDDPFCTYCGAMGGTVNDCEPDCPWALCQRVDIRSVIDEVAEHATRIELPAFEANVERHMPDVAYSGYVIASDPRPRVDDPIIPADIPPVRRRSRWEVVYGCEYVESRCAHCERPEIVTNAGAPCMAKLPKTDSRRISFDELHRRG